MAQKSGGSVRKVVVPSDWFTETRKKLEEEARRTYRQEGLSLEQEQLLKEFHGKVTQSKLAELLGVSYNSCRYNITRLGIGKAGRMRIKP